MSVNRRTATIAGVLWIAATVLALAGSALTAPVLTSAASVMRPGVSGRVIAGALIGIAAAMCCPLIAAVMFPVLKRFSEGLAIGYVAIRVLEAVTMLFTGMAVLLLVTVGRGVLGSGFEQLLHGAYEWAFPLDPIVFGPGAVLVYSAMLRMRIVPTWLSVWGLLGALSVTVFGVLAMFGQSLIWLALPIAVQEMVLAVWLIAKGFAEPSAEPRPASVTTPALGAS